jgi:hypothetical protein
MISQKLRSSWLIAVVAASIVACGGSGHGDAANPGGGGGGPIGGITGTGAFASLGTVTGFGSIIVNGIEYDTSTATFTIDGDSNGSEDDLAVGDIVLVRGTIDDDNVTNGVAESVEFDDNVEGPIEAGSISIDPVDPTAGTFVVLGQTVHFDSGTSYDDGISPPSIDGLSDGDIVEVSGLVRSDGGVQATRIELKTLQAGDMFEVTGLVSDPLTATSFLINDLVVDFATRSATFDNFPSGRNVAVGDLVEVKGEQILGPNDELIATRVEFKGDRLDGNDGDHMELEGFITDFTSQQIFDVSHQAVNCGAGCVVTTEGMAGGTLALNVKVEVKGQLENGVIVATSVDIRLGNAVRVTAVMQEPVNVDGTGQAVSIVLLGITFDVDARTRFEDKDGSAPIEIFNIVDLAVGDYLEIRGQEDGSGGVFAVIVERDDPDTETILQGFIDVGGANKPTLDILGVRVVTDGATVFQRVDDSIITDPDNGFWDVVGDGSLIKAKGQNSTVSGSLALPPVTFIAEEVEIQLE